jgi:hypothetical protein
MESLDSRGSLKGTSLIKQKVKHLVRNYGFNSYYKPTLERSRKK